MTETTASSVAEDTSVGSGTSEGRKGDKGKGKAKQSKCVSCCFVYSSSSAEGE